MQPGRHGAVDGAQCALHQGVSARSVCARCGNFMCTACSDHGIEPQCPTCRTLAAPDFPFDATADFGALWAHVVSSFQREMGMCILAIVLFIALTIGGGIVAGILSSVVQALLSIKAGSLGSSEMRIISDVLISQFVSFLVGSVVQGVALVGLYRVLMDALAGKKVDLGRMFSQLQLLPRYLLVQIVLFFVITIPMLISMALVTLAAMRIMGLELDNLAAFDPSSLLNPSLYALSFGACVAFLVALVVLLPLVIFSVPELIVGQCGALEAIKRAWTLGEGQRLRIFGYTMVAGLLTIAGTFACLIGLLFAMPVAYMLWLALFLALRNSSTLPAATHA